MVVLVKVVVAILLCGIISIELTECVRTKNKIYKDLQTQNACFRSLNATHQIGCTSASGGNVGILHYLENQEDYDWVLKDGPNAPYAVLMNSKNFTSDNVDTLVASKRVNGILVINVPVNDTRYPTPSQFSADKSCPNDGYGMYKDNSKYKHCQAVKWNKGQTENGMLFKDYGIPMFSLPNITDVERLINDCYEKFNRPVNGIARSYPLCAVQLTDSMDGAKDSVTCTRRTNRITNLSNPARYCDPLGDQNVVVTMKTVTREMTRPSDSVIVVATKMDTLSMFYNEYPSADGSVLGIVTLLAVAETLASLQADIQKTKDSKDIMMTFFQGESFDYIGSSRMVYDMESLVFPQKFDKVDDKGLHPINLTSIHSFIELSQLGLLQNGSFWIHTDPLTRGDVETKVNTLIQELKQECQAVNVDVEKVPEDIPLPPASVQRFLMKKSIPALVLADHEREFTNKYYNSRFDLPSFINVTNHTGEPDPKPDSQTKSITNLATALARFLYKLSTGKSSTVTANETTVESLLQCYLYDQHCELFRRSVDPEDAKSLAKAKKPFPFYVGVNHQTNQVTSLTRSLLAQYLGVVVNNSKDDCKQPENDQTYQYLWIQGERNVEGKRPGKCIKSLSMLTVAKSPAFDIDGYDWSSGKYSTWTESVWDPLKVRMFLVPSEQSQVLTLCVGIAMLLLSLISVYFISRSADVIFNNGSSQPVET